MNKLFSSFSQTKALLWKEQMDAILSNKFIAPVGAVIDLTNKCNLGCYWCNAKSYRSDDTLETPHVMKIIDMLSAWGVKSVCFAGGGEPSLHPDFYIFVNYAASIGMEVGISTNGIALNKPMIDAIKSGARFCGFSIDAGTVQTWTALKRGSIEMWKRMLDNAKKLNIGIGLDTTYKVMVTPDNQHELFMAAKLARKLKFKNFYCRFPAFENVPDVSPIMLYDKKRIESQLKKVNRLESETFHVYANGGRGINKNYSKKLTFSKCNATPLMAVFCADGWCYPCIDLRGRKEFRMCHHLDIVNYWSSKEHLNLLKTVDINKCPRCAFAHYNEAIEAYENDYMFRWFP